MKSHSKIARFILGLCAALALVAPIGTPAALASPAQGTTAAPVAALSKAGGSDFLYVGDGDDTVKRFDAASGAYLGDFVTSGSQGLLGPRGLIFAAGKLFVNNQNSGLHIDGEVLQYSGTSGAPLGALVPCNPKLGRQCDKNAPFDPRGLLAIGTSVYVADLSNFTGQPGRVLRFGMQTGAFLGTLDTTGFPGDFYPRGMVLGPDGRLYVSVVGNLAKGDRLTGYVLRFDPSTGKFVDVFTSNQAAGCAAGLHRPEGLAFGPDGKLYVTAFQANANDTDKVLIFDAAGTCVNHIDLDQGGVDANNNPLPRAFGQALLFGPSGFLYIPIQGNGPATGAVRRYNVTQSNFPYSNLVVPNANGGPLVAPWYLTFGQTNPSTLAYGG